MTLQEKHSPHPESVSAERESPMAEQIPEAKGLTWIDKFYDGKKGIVAVLDVDPELVTKHKMWQLLPVVLLFPLCLVLTAVDDRMGATMKFFYLLLFGFFSVTILFGLAFMDHQSLGKDHHVAITTEGIRIDPHPSMSVTTKFQSIKSCELSSSGEIQVKSTKNSEVGKLVGLRNPLCGVLRAEECVHLVQAMNKRHCELTVNDGFPASSSMLRKADNRPDIPETQPITWKDPFYDGNDSLIAVFDRDNDAVRRATNAEMLAPISIVFLPCFGVSLAISSDPAVAGFFLFSWLTLVVYFYFSLLRNLGEDQHLALTREGIRLDNGQHYFVTLPYDSFSTCQAIPCDDIIPNRVAPGLKHISLTGPPKGRRGTLHVDRLHKLLTGIEQAQEFVDLVMAMKRNREQVSETSIDNPGGYKGVSTTQSVQIV